MLRIFYPLLFVFVFMGCQATKEDLPQTITYDAFLIIGQSNTHFGDGEDTEVSEIDTSIYQLGRRNEDEMKLIPAKEPLQNFTQADDRIGFAMTFARLYAQIKLDTLKRIALLPCAHSGTGFADSSWNKGDRLYEDAKYRVNTFLKDNPGSQIKGILWHQGENDVNNPDYQANLDQFIHDFRTDTKTENVPFILGGMVPFWTDQSEDRIKTQTIIATTPNRVNNTGYVDPCLPIPIRKANDSINSLHYDADGLREFGRRYFLEYLKMTAH